MLCCQQALEEREAREEAEILQPVFGEGLSAHDNEREVLQPPRREAGSGRAHGSESAEEQLVSTDYPCLTISGVLDFTLCFIVASFFCLNRDMASISSKFHVHPGCKEAQSACASTGQTTSLEGAASNPG